MPLKALYSSQRGIFAAVLVDSMGGAAPLSQGLLKNRMAEANRFEIMKPSPDRILIVEDEENARLGYEALLRRWGYEVLGVGNAEEDLMLGSTGATPPGPADVERFFTSTWRWFETRDKDIPTPTPIQGRWNVDGIGLPRAILERVYHANAEKVLGVKVVTEGAR